MYIKCTEKDVVFVLSWSEDSDFFCLFIMRFNLATQESKRLGAAINGGGLFMFTSRSNALMIKMFHDVYLVLNDWIQELNC